MHAASTIANAEITAADHRGRLAGICDRRFWWVMAAITTVAAVIRLAVLREFWLENPFAAFPTLDGELYWQQAGALAEGRWIGDEPFHIAPLYLYMLGLLRWSGGGLLTLYGLQLVLHLATGAILGATARFRFGSAAGCAATLVFFSLSEPALFATRILGTTLQLLLVSILWWEWAQLAGAPQPGSARSIRVAVWFGLLALAFPAALLLLPVFAGWLMYRAGRAGDGRTSNAEARRIRLGGIGRAALAAAAGAAVVGTATLHNYLAVGEFIPITSHAGITLAAGNAPGSIGIYTPLHETDGTVKHQARVSALAFERATGRSGSWREIDAHYRNRVLAWWRDHPFDAALLFGRKAWWLLTSWRYDNVTAFSLERKFGLQDAAAWVPVETPWILGFAVLGAILTRKRLRNTMPEFALTVLPIVVCIVFMYSARYRILAVPVLCGFAGFAAVAWRMLPRPRPALLAAAALPAVLLLINSISGFGSVDFMRDEFAALLADSHIAAGGANRDAGDSAASEAHFLRAAEVQPNRPDAHSQLARLYIGAERFEEARGAALHAVRRDRTSEVNHRLLYDAQIGSQDYRNAEITLNMIEKLAPTSGSVQVAMAWFYASCPEARLRNAVRSLHHARAAQRVLGSDDPNVVMARALAEAANGDFDGAEATARRGGALAGVGGDPLLAAEFERLALHAGLRREIASPPPRLAGRRPS